MDKNAPSWGLGALGSVGGFVIGVGIYVLLGWPLGPGHPTFNLAAPIALVGLGAMMLIPALVGLFVLDRVSEVRIDDSGLHFTYNRGRIVALRWTDPALSIVLSHALPQGTPKEPEWGDWFVKQPPGRGGWIVRGKNTGTGIHCTVDKGAGDAIIRRAIRLGLQVGTMRKELGRGNQALLYERTSISRAGQPASTG
jgi:hypothetical protein